MKAKENEKGELDLVIDNSLVQPYVWPLLVADFPLFLLLIFVGVNNLAVGLPVFAVWSAITGAMIGLAMVRIDENMGARVLGITASITFLCALIAIYSEINFAGLSRILFLALLGLLVANIIRLFVRVALWQKRVIAFFGVFVFILYLLVDFDRLKQLQRAGENSWPSAMNIAIDIYLDIINLFLDLLDLLSENGN